MHSSTQQTSDNELLALTLEYEAGSMEMQGIVTWFSYLVDRGLIWKLPTEYLDMVANMKEMGFLFPDKTMN